MRSGQRSSLIPGTVSFLRDTPASAPSRFYRRISKLSLSLQTCAVQGSSWRLLAGPWIECGIPSSHMLRWLTFCFLCLSLCLRLRPPHRGPSARPILMRLVKARVRKVKVPEVGKRGQMQECPMTSKAVIAAPPRVIPFALITSVATVSAQ